MKSDICCIGHITVDKVITPGKEVIMPGGTAYYFAKALNSLGIRDSIIITKTADSQKEVVDSMIGEGITVKAGHSRRPVMFENIYGENSNNRIQKVHSKADPFQISDIEGIDAKVFHLGTLLADDFPLDFIKDLSQKAPVAVDAQGFLRKVVGEDIQACEWNNIKEFMPYITILKANEHESVSLTGLSDPHEAAKRIASWGVKEVVLTLGDEGSLIFTDGKFYEVPAYPVSQVVDATGCGDTYMAGYLWKRGQGGDPLEAGRYAAAMCSLKLQNSGPFHSSPEEVESLCRQK